MQAVRVGIENRGLRGVKKPLLKTRRPRPTPRLTRGSGGVAWWLRRLK